jgi:hypothetical protein
MFLNYFQYKLFDYNGENIETSNTYENVHKIKLFIDNKDEKFMYIRNSPLSHVYIESQEESKKDENFFGPQRSKKYLI